jgi:hypothetical protein
LRRYAATLNIEDEIEIIHGIGHVQRLEDGDLMNLQGKVFLENPIPLLHDQGEIPVTGPQIDPGNARFPSACPVILNDAQTIPPLYL